MKKKWLTSILPEQMELATLLSGLPEKYSVQEGSVSFDTISYLDTFDWRLYEQKLICQFRGNGTYLLTDFAGGNRIQADGPGPKKLFAHDLAGGVLGEKLSAVAGIRALLPLTEIARRSQSFQVVNRDHKLILSGFLELSQLLNPDDEPIFLGGSLRMQEVRGYDKIVMKVTELLQSRGLESGKPEERVLRLALAASGRSPLDYCSQFSIVLDPSETIAQAARKIFLQLLEAMERNIPGIVEDIDAEFLHDFRVALRRTRSLLGSMKKRMPAADVDFYQRGLQEIGAFTGPVRDLDVYLLEKDVYHSMLPEGLQEGLSVFFKELSGQRVKELHRLKKAFQSRKLKQFLAGWRSYVEDSLLTTALVTAHEPCRKVAVKAIRKRLRRILKDGSLIGPQSPDDTLHCVRIQAKKLRYLLEFYRSLFPKTEMDSLLKSLKKLQNNLGSFNDLSVQQNMLAQYQLGLNASEQRQALQVAAAIGGLITHLHEEQVSVRQKFEQTFEQFSSAKNRKLCDVLFNKFPYRAP
ncbi:MAG: CHAD domain-containing protein [Desulfoarculaceae bacterium]|nr:CHAD domain-containing protein [Desulfoarculaceae bacterium]